MKKIKIIEGSENKFALKENATLEDVVGLGGFKGYTICGSQLYVENFRVSGVTSIAQGAGSISSQDVSLICDRRAIISFPIKDIRSIRIRGLNVMFFLKSGLTIEFIRN